ncbi:hypothetical protein BBBOND_0210450 [Babesia bigemina]|uniref:Uncharacterized protein n=1 Tax=Babesia bigemina TaxID=5866 RepID=A0A061D7D7_BABBI|nr:hypothetical protein BBBOND_0210450 [Babesia bigemina]CDR95892.1 hypothetical protein BBBOND_0210450 [Babesia bigemina]|eukprot:XP_012768078.1 hypothetical protein BBBOND_0210450 [Babesia bigemina]
MVYHSLTEAPHNLKEAVDWLVALKGTDAEKNLRAIGAAVHKFLADKPVGKMDVPAVEEVKLISKKFLEKLEFTVMWPTSVLLEKFKRPMNKNPGFFVKAFGFVDKSDYKNAVEAKGLTAEAIAENLGTVVYGCEKFLGEIKTPATYNSAYSSKATWDASCAKDPEACAVVFVGIAPMLWAGLHSLRQTILDEPHRYMSYGVKSSLSDVLKALGYDDDDCLPGVNRPDVGKALSGLKPRIFEFIYDLCGFWAFY